MRRFDPSRLQFWPTVLISTIVTAALVLAVVRAVISPSPSFSIKLINRPGMADQIHFYDSESTWRTGKTDHASVVGGRLTLADERAAFPRRGSWTSGQVITPYHFTELLPSYNPSCPADTGVRIDVRVRDPGNARWSPWFYLGSWGRTITAETGYPRIIKDDVFRAVVNEDYLILARPADAYQVKVEFYAFNLDEKINPALRRLAIAFSGFAPEQTTVKLAEQNGDASSFRSDRTGALAEPWARDLRVPFRAQGVASKPLRPEICSPTSVSMVMQHLGVNRPTEENALGIYDAEYDLFGNWQRAVAWAGENGLDAWLARFRNFEQVKEMIARGQPIIASIRFAEGEAPSFVMKKTAGHLIVIRGMTKDGDFIVNDPASKEKGDGAIYKAADMERAWLNHGGVGYIIRKPQL